jgi:hypothetical protein
MPVGWIRSVPVALDKSSLASGLEAIFKEQPSSGAQAASKIASKYDAYCKGGQAGPGLPLITPAAKKALEGHLAAAMAVPAGDAVAVASAFSTGIMAYWMTPPVPCVGGAASGVVTAMPGAGAVVGPLTAAFKNTKNSETAIANQIASALDVATRTVLVTYATPTPTPPPPATVM